MRPPEPRQQASPGPDPVALPELDEQGRAAFEHGGRGYAVFTVDGEPVVTDGACPHRGGPLAEGLLRDGAVVCPWHWFVFDLRTGACRTADAGPLVRYRVSKVAHRWFVDLPTVRTPSWADVLRRHARGQRPTDPSQNDEDDEAMPG
jgi:nitrite reductase (NADH) small subunit